VVRGHVDEHMQRWRVTDEFRAFMREVVAKLDWGDGRDALVGPDALGHECGRGGRLDDSDVYRFVCSAPDGHGGFELDLVEPQIRAVAAGELEELDVRDASEGRVRRGEPLLVWGEYDGDALRVRALADLEIALAGIYAFAAIEPCVLRLWSSADDQIVGVVNGLDCALYVVHSAHGYGTSIGDASRPGAFELDGHDLGTLAVAWAQCLPWRAARDALIRFAEHGDVGDIALDGSIPTQLLVAGDFDRAAVLATRRAPPTDPALSSLPRKAPHGAWAQRLLRALVELQLVELDTAVFDAIAARTAILLLQMGDDAQESPEAAQQLAKSLTKLRGVSTLFATASDLQIALRRTQDPPTLPVEMPLS
jgi:hypothetical protein